MPKSKKPAPKGGKKAAAPKKVAKRAPAKKQLTARQIDQLNADKMRADSLASTQPAAPPMEKVVGYDYYRDKPVVGYRPVRATVEEQWDANRPVEERTVIPAYSTAKKPTRWQRFRSAITGLFVSRKTAEANPDTTVREKAD